MSRPGPITHLPIALQEEYARIASPDEMKALYDTLKGGTEASQEARIKEIIERILQTTDQQPTK